MVDSARKGRPYLALFWLDRGARSCAVFPARAPLVFLAFLATFFLVLALSELELRSYVAHGLINSAGWQAENAKISLENYRKMLNSVQSPIVRSKGYSPPVIGSRRRILVIGDSFIWGDGLTNLNMTWWRQLEWELRRRGYHDVDVVAAGTNGASTQDEYHWISDLHLIDKTKPDAVVFGYVTNDPIMKDARGNDLIKQAGEASGRSMEISSPLWRGLYSLASAVFPIISSQMRARVSDKTLYKSGNALPYGLWELKILDGENFREYKQLLGTLAKTIEMSRLPTFFVSTPNSPDEGYFQPRFSAAKKAFGEAGIRFFDVLPEFVSCCARRHEDLLAWAANPANGHPGPEATRFIAKQVANLLESNYPTILGPKSKSSPELLPSINDWLPAGVDVRSVGKGEWTAEIPLDRQQLLFLPIKKSHIALNFAEPVALSQVHLAFEKEVDVSAWATVLDPATDAEQKEYKFIGTGEGSNINIAVPKELESLRITSLRLAVWPKAAPTENLVVSIAPDKIVPLKGYAYDYPIPSGLSSEGDDLDLNSRSTLKLYENGRLLGPAHSFHNAIAKLGKGRFSHWGHDLYFSTSDNSDPRTNGRVYTLKAGRLQMHMMLKFQGRAVRL